MFIFSLGVKVVDVCVGEGKGMIIQERNYKGLR